MNKPVHIYALNLGIEVLRPVCDMWSQKKKRPIRMKRWRKLSKYAARAVKGKPQPPEVKQ